MTTTTEEKLTIPMSERRPLKIVKSEWPKVAHGSAFSGQHEFQAFDGARISVRRHADGRTIVYGYAGDWDGGGRPTRENRTAGFLVESSDRPVYRDGEIAGRQCKLLARHRPDDEETVRAIRRVAGILADTECVGEMAERAARDCIADLPAEPLDGGSDEPETETLAIDGSMPVTTERLALLLALLIRCKPYVPAEIQDEIRDVLSGGRSA
jgi:hypothetical protein